MVCKHSAMARIRGGEMIPSLRGTVRMFQEADGVLVVAQIYGLPETESNFFGFHIHEGESCGGVRFADTAGHYDPQSARHPGHAGDLPPLLSCGGKAFLAVKTDRFRLPDVFGRTVVIHSQRDDFKSQPAGDAGAKIACGKICPM